MRVDATSRDEQTIQRYLSGKYDAEIFPFYDGYNDINGNAVDVSAARLHQFFVDNGYEIDTSYTDTWHYRYTFRTLDAEIQACNLTFNIRDWHVWYYGTENVTVSINIKTNLYKSPGGSSWYRIKSPIVITEDYDIEMEEMEKNDDDVWEPTGKTVMIRAAGDLRVLLIVKYAGWRPLDCPDITNPVPTIEGTDLIYREDVMAKIYTMETLMFPIRHDYSFVESERYQKVLLSDWGFDQDELYENLDNEDIKESFFSFSISGDEIKYMPADILKLIEQMYGNIQETIGQHNELEFPEFYDPGSSSPADVVISNDYYRIKYDGELEPATPIFGDDSELVFDYKIRINGFEFSPYLTDEDGKRMPLFIVPLDPMRRTPMRKKYDVIKYGFTIWGFMQKTIKLKWYQTGFFRFITFIFGAIFAFVTFGVVGLAMFAIQQTLGILGRLLGPLGSFLMNIFMLGFNPMSMSWSFSAMIDNIMNNFFNIMLNFGKVMMQLQFQGKYDALTEELESTRDETKDMAEKLRDMVNPTIYSPLDVLGNQYDLLYRMQFMPYEDSTYDMMGQLDHSLTTPIQQSRIM
jgi:hypothetical protein